VSEADLAAARRSKSLVLAVDLGTGGPKVGLVSLTGQVAWQDHIAVKTRYLHDGGAVQDAEEWWQIIRDATRRAMATVRVRADHVVAVSVTGQWGSTVPVSANGRPVSDCLMWMDTRGRHHCQQAFAGRAMGYSPRTAVAWIRRCGVPPPVEGDNAIGHMLYFERDRPEVAAAARWYLEPVDYLTMRFTGIAAASPASIMGTRLTDIRKPDACAYDPLLIRLSGVNSVKLPVLRPTGSVIGTVTEATAADLGISTRAQVVTGTPDLHSAAVGSGAVADGQAHLAVSTTSWISCPVTKKTSSLLRHITAVPGLTADRYLLTNDQNSAGRCLQWLRDDIISPAAGHPAASPGNSPDYRALAALAATVPPGSDNVIFVPWLTGENAPIADSRARAGFLNLSLTTTQAHLIRAVLEGVAYNSRWLLNSVEKLTRHRIDPIRLLGGGAQADLWCQIFADVLDRHIERVAEPLHASMRGAALLAGIALGDVRRQDVINLVNVDATFSPDPANRPIYERMFAEFPRLYQAHKGMFARLNHNP
jgi:xylulokinase